MNELTWFELATGFASILSFFISVITLRKVIGISNSTITDNSKIENFQDSSEGRFNKQIIKNG